MNILFTGFWGAGALARARISHETTRVVKQRPCTLISTFVEKKHQPQYVSFKISFFSIALNRERVKIKFKNKVKVKATGPGRMSRSGSEVKVLFSI